MTGAQLRTRYRRGATIRQLARESGQSTTSIHAALRASGFSPRHPGRKPGSVLGQTRALQIRARSLRTAGHTWAEVAEAMGMSQGYVWSLANSQTKPKTKTKK